MEGDGTIFRGSGFLVEGGDGTIFLGGGKRSGFLVEGDGTIFLGMASVADLGGGDGTIFWGSGFWWRGMAQYFEEADFSSMQLASVADFGNGGHI